MGHRFYYGWVIVGVAWLGFFAAAAAAPPVLSVFMATMSAELGWSRTLMAGAASIGTLAMVPVLPVVGRLLDRYGSRWVVTSAGLGVGGGLLGLAWVRGPWGFYIGFGLSYMLAQGVIRIANTTAVSNWFIRRRGRAQGIAYLGRAVGATALPMIAFLIMRTYGWRASWLALGIIVLLILVVPAAVFLKRRPEDIGLRPDGLPAEGGLPLAAIPTRPHSTDPEAVWSLSEATRTPALWLITAAIFIQGVVGPGVVIHLMPFLLDRGLDPAASAAVVSLGSASMGVGSMISGMLAERASVGRLLAAVMVSQAISLVMLLLTHDAPLAFAYAVVGGMSRGATSTLEGVIWANYFGRTSLGTIQGFTQPFASVGLALGPIVAGLSYDLTGSYQVAFLMFIFGYLLAAALLLVARPPRKPAGSR